MILDLKRYDMGIFVKKMGMIWVWYKFEYYDECFKRDLGHYMPFPFNSYMNNITLSTRSLEHYMTFLFVPAVRYGEPFLDQVHYLTSKKFWKAGQ